MLYTVANTAANGTRCILGRITIQKSRFHSNRCCNGHFDAIKLFCESKNSIWHCFGEYTSLFSDANTRKLHNIVQRRKNIKNARFHSNRYCYGNSDVGKWFPDPKNLVYQLWRSVKGRMICPEPAFMVMRLSLLLRTIWTSRIDDVIID